MAEIFRREIRSFRDGDEPVPVLYATDGMTDTGSYDVTVHSGLVEDVDDVREAYWLSLVNQEDGTAQDLTEALEDLGVLIGDPVAQASINISSREREGVLSGIIYINEHAYREDRVRVIMEHLGVQF